MINRHSTRSFTTLIFIVLTLATSITLAVETPRPEHPRPDLYRDNWLTLNGEWQFEIDKKGDGDSRGLTHGTDLAARIIVPFCPESQLSGIGLGNTQKFKEVWYRRMFKLPETLEGKRVRIHFGAVDYKAWIYINGQQAGSHVGGNAAFSVEITQFLKAGENEVVVKVIDDMESGLQASGKQSVDQSEGCFYTRTTGIWQSVWLEAVGSSFVETISVTPDPDRSRVFVDAKINGADKNLTLKVEAFLDGRIVGSDTSSGGWENHLVVNLSEKKLWQPRSPVLYDLKFTLSSGSEKMDELKSYFGLRKIAIDGRKILLNDQPVFQRLILDQGFYPEGLWTAPTDDALKKDIEMAMACGYNGARLHQKVFEPRFLYWADRLGYMVWGEYPNAGYNNQAAGYAAVVNEWTEILLRDRNHPSIVGWCAFNENNAGGEIQQMVWHVTKAIDPSRPALEASGWTHTLSHPDVCDAHDYNGKPESLRKKWHEYFTTPPTGERPPARYIRLADSKVDIGVPFMISEIGGIGWATEGGWGYGEGPKTMDEFYKRYQGTIDAMLDNPNLFGFCYTQLTDIEQEKNGLYFYDRKPKFDLKKIHQITAREAAYERGEEQAPLPTGKCSNTKWRVLVGGLPDGDLGTPYHYNGTGAHLNKEWLSDGFNDASWSVGLSPFGAHEDSRTEWKTPEIYLRKSFEFDGSEFQAAAVVIYTHGAAEVYLNGQKLLSLSMSKGYELHSVTEEMKKSLKKGKNTLAVFSRQEGRDPWLDLAILIE